ncbi:hypothetical protein CN568_24160 [Bacillus pseudomycoides]|uniref:hypothetical protein n=1 Tax=Bacillus pseudomycoides TaxID=64104 RepID=UPI000BF20CF3|nr:hypothetical protein [Bacillus pseudomycoides]PEK39641.1 hypothetical protein CN691_02595 [Bacillus pseudomycoides]PEK66396.1 hypothetical protein CN593_18160 [Bacillus pseudomycoides]PEP38734.1 hypothetical protein CN568_24160 [Bacillus pseudomycoides]PEP40655.1 hypothetical protein CN565_16285 [Bacillus pseudomycoides]PFX44323.1 hypothetical protein COL31_26950 [Bacillus pseudomycoides]
MRRIVITCRHPGPTWFIAEAIPTLTSKYEIYLLLSDTAITFIVERYPSLLINERVQVFYLNKNIIEKINVKSFELSNDNIDGSIDTSLILESMIKFFKEIDFDIVIRTTPVTGIDVDEILPTAVRNVGYSGPILGIQDYYGVGNILNDGEDDLLKYGVTHLATVDNLAVEIMKHRFSGPIRSTGWLAHDLFLRSDPLSMVRENIRSSLGISQNQKVVFYACSALQYESDFIGFEHVLTSLVELNLDVTFLYKVHPRMTHREISKYADILNEFGKGLKVVPEDEFSDYLEYLAVSDLVISTASMVNLDTLAYTTLQGSFNDVPVSLYIEDDCIRQAILKATGLLTLPTHLAGHGSLCTNLLDLKETINQGLVNTVLRENILKEAAYYFKIKDPSAIRLLDYIEEIWGEF